jgi:iron(III) transport system ATP-binding protein
MLQIQEISFQYQPEKSILEKIHFELKKGEILSILGESGSGKSTLLRLIYGLEDVQKGEIWFDQEKVTGPKHNLVPGNPAMKFVPQEFDLLNSITVGENVGKYLSNFDLPLKKENIELALDTVNMLHHLNTYPSQLSGGQRQRVSIARAIATQPNVLLLDEPYSHLDQPLKFDIRKKIWNWAKSTNCTLILTTHDVNDAMGFSDQILVLKEGKQIQKDSPENLRNQPDNDYVASLLGEYSKWNAAEMKRIFQVEISSDEFAIIYPEEVEISENGVEFEIVDIRYRGRDFLIEAKKEVSRLMFYANVKPVMNKISLKLTKFRTVKS